MNKYNLSFFYSKIVHNFEGILLEYKFYYNRILMKFNSNTIVQNVFFRKEYE